MCAVAGGYAYVAEVETPERCVQIGLKPVVRVIEAVEAGLLVFVGFQTLVGWGADGVAWETGRLSWEGITGFGLGWGADVGYGVGSDGRCGAGVCRSICGRGGMWVGGGKARGKGVLTPDGRHFVGLLDGSRVSGAE